MAGLLGDFDNSTATTSFSNRRRIKEELPKKTRRLSPPLKRRGDRPRVKAEPESPPKAMRSSPPPFLLAASNDDYHDDYDDDLVVNTNYDGDDVTMENMPEQPSSPTVKAVQRKTRAMALDDDDEDNDEDDDEVAVMEVKGVKGMRAAAVNISASKPVPKIEEKEPLTIAAQAIDSSTWKNVTANLNVAVPAGDSIGAGKLDPKDAVEEDGSLNFFWIDYAEVGGSLCLFGKIKVKGTSKYASCFVKVDQIMRCMYFLPREYRIRGYPIPSKGRISS